MIKTIEDIYTESTPLVEIFNAFAIKHNLIGRAVADHISHKCDSKESFESIRAILELESEYIYQSIIAGRRIDLIRFKKPISTVLGDIKFLELSDQKPNGTQVNGFDHIEVYPLTFSYDEMIVELEKEENVIKVERPHHTTHDIKIGKRFIFRCTLCSLVEKIKREEMI